jgi:hypothetical protein
LVLLSIAVLLLGVCGGAVKADTYRSGEFAFQVPPDLVDAKSRIAFAIGVESEKFSHFQNWERPPCYRIVSPATNSYKVPLARLLDLLKQRADLDLPACGAPNQPGITYLLTAGNTDVIAADVIRRFPTQSDVVIVVRGELPELHCAWLLGKSSEDIITDALVVVNATLGSSNLQRCLYLLTVKSLGLASPDYTLTEDTTLGGAANGLRTPLEFDLLALFVLYHADTLVPEERADRGAQINRALTLMYFQGEMQ